MRGHDTGGAHQRQVRGSLRRILFRTGDPVPVLASMGVFGVIRNNACGDLICNTPGPVLRITLISTEF